MSSKQALVHGSETLPLEVLVRRELTERPGPVALGLWADHGFGKTTALAHLAATLRDIGDVRWIDDPDENSIESATRDARPVRIVFTANQSAHPWIHCTTLAIAPWRDDDVIEYLLARHRDRIGSVMSRVQGDEHRHELDGSPLLWTIVLDAMAADDSIPDCAAALCAHLDCSLDTDDALDAAGFIALQTVCGKEPPKRVIRGCRKVEHLLHQPLVRKLLAAEHITWNLARGQDSDDLEQILPMDLIDVVARRVANRPATIQHLESILAKPSDRRQHAMAASILVRAKPDWRKVPRLAFLQNASLPGAKWAEVDLHDGDVACADLSGADLCEANFHELHAVQTRFDRAFLGAAIFTDATADSARFVGADLRKARFDRSKLNSAEFDRANLSFASFRRAIMDNSSLRGASLTGAIFNSASLEHAKVDDADLSDADFSLARLHHVALNTARTCERANFRRAEMCHADLSGMQMSDGADFVKANLDQVDLTGSSMPDADFHSAKLTNAGLANVDWPNADLRRADFTGASFHLGSSRSGLVGSTIPCEGSRTGFYTDEFDEREFKSAEEIRKANLRGADLRGAKVEGTDWYLVDLRDATYSARQREHFARCGGDIEVAPSFT